MFTIFFFYFEGWGWKSTRTTLKLISFYPEEINLWNELGVQYLLIKGIDDARDAFKEARNTCYYVFMSLLICLSAIHTPCPCDFWPSRHNKIV